jgi:hypothetical protein
MKKRRDKFYIILLLLILSSCTSLDKEEYEVLNAAIDQVVFKRIDQDYVSQIMEEKNIDYNSAVNIVQDEMSKKEYTYTISDTLYPVDISKETWEKLHYDAIFDEVKNRSDKPITIDFSKIKPTNHIRKINKPISDSTNYLGHFKFHRVLFDKSRKRAYVQINIRKRSGFAGLIFEKENGEWKLEK